MKPVSADNCKCWQCPQICFCEPRRPTNSNGVLYKFGGDSRETCTTAPIPVGLKASWSNFARKKIRP